MGGSALRGAMVIAVFALVAVGCSGDSAIPRSEYTQRANDLCRATTGEIDRVLVPVIEEYILGLGAGTPTDEEVMGLYAATLPTVRELNEVFDTMLADLRALPAPDTDADVFLAHWSRMEELWDRAFEDLVTASTDVDAPQTLLAEPDSRLAPTNAEATDLGINECVFD